MDGNLLYYLGVLIKITLTLLVGGITTLYFLLSWNHNYWKKMGIPYAKPYPFVGNLGFLMRRSYSSFLFEIAQKFKGFDYFGAYFFHRPALIVQCPKLAQRILVTESEKFRDRLAYSGGDDPLGQLNLFSVKNPLWVKVRKEVTPLFTSSRLRGLCKTMNMNAQELVKYIDLNHIQGNKQVNLKNLLLRYTTDTIGYTVFGLKTSAFNDENNPLWIISKQMVRFHFWRGLEFTTIFLAPDIASVLRFKFFSDKGTKYVKKLFYTLLEERRKSGKYEEKDLLSYYLKIEEKFESDGNVAFDDIVAAQSAVFILGALETSTSTMTFAINELAHNPDVQEKVYQEICAVKERTGKEILEYEDLIELKYLTAVILETLRIYVPSPMVDRDSTAPFELDGKIIEKNTAVIINLQSLHLNENYFPDPLKWDPERFLGDDENTHKHYTFLPFGAGPRFCAGKRYGMLQVRAALAQVLYNYRVEPDSHHRDLPHDPYSILLSPINGGSAKFVSRH